MSDKPSGATTSSTEDPASAASDEAPKPEASPSADAAPSSDEPVTGETRPLPRPDGTTQSGPEGGFAPPSIPGIRTETTKPIDAGDISAASQGNPQPLTLEPMEPPPGEAVASGAAEGLFGNEPDIPEFALEGDDDPLNEKTVDLEIPREISVSGPSTDESATVEGAPLMDSHTEVSASPPAAGERVTADDGAIIQLDAPLGDQRGSVFFRSRVQGDEQAYTAVWTPDPPAEPPWPRVPDPRIVRPRCRATLEGAAVRVFERPKGNTVVDYLADGERFLPAMATLELGLELAEILESLHGAGCYIYDLDPSQIVIERGGRVRLYAINGFCPHARPPPQQAGLFAAPEVRRRLTYLMGAHSDVFGVALMLYALLARRSPIDTDLDPNLLLNPRVFRPECPLGIWPYLAPCLAAVPGKRVGHARGLRAQLLKARGRLLAEAAAADNPEPTVLEAWAELHTGLGKKRRGAPQQDRALSVTDEEGQVGLYIIADGVSRSRYGDGAFAAESVEMASAQRWAQLEKQGPAGMALSHPQRVDVLRQIARTAGKRISQDVNERFTPLANEPNQVMSTTLCAAYIVHGEATFANLGDSRSYLIRDETIERISIDHDRTTDALRMGLSFREASEVRMGSALTRVVGRVIIDENGNTRPDPFEPEVSRVRLLPGDVIVLCSDGVADFAAGPGASQEDAEERMLETILEFEDPARAAYELVVLANRAGGYDNISCVVIAVHPG